MDREYQFTCENCDLTYSIITEEEDHPQMCPFCGFSHDTHDLDEDEDDWLDE